MPTDYNYKPKKGYTVSKSVWQIERDAARIRAGMVGPPCICRTDPEGRRWLSLGCRAHTNTWRPQYSQKMEVL